MSRKSEGRRPSGGGALSRIVIVSAIFRAFVARHLLAVGVALTAGLLILVNGLGHLALDRSARGGSVASAVLEVVGVSVLGAFVGFVAVRLAAGRLARLA